MRALPMQNPFSSRIQDVANNCKHLKRTSKENCLAEKSLCLLEQGKPLSENELVEVLQYCRREKDVQNGERCYAYLRRHGLQTSRSLGNYLVPMLVEIRFLEDAQEIFGRLPFPNVHAWNSLLTGFVNCGKANHALSLYKKMQDDPLHPNAHTFIAVLSACAKLADKEYGCQLHAEIARKGLGGNPLVGSTLLHLYTKCGLFNQAQELFDGIDVKDTITWTSMITGYVKFGLNEQALIYYDQMQSCGLIPNPLTFVSSLKACGCVGSIEQGQIMHAEIARRGLFEEDIFVGNAVIDMYAKCGLVSKAQEVFDLLPNRDAVSWNALITGYANVGNTVKVFTCFNQMQVEEVTPDPFTFVCNLKACTDANDLETGQQLHMDSAMRGFAQEAILVGNALVDMYATCGLLAEAKNIFESLCVQDAVAWTTLISGFTKYGFAEEALVYYERMQLKGVSADVVTYICILKACSSIGSIHKGQEIEAEIHRLQLLKIYASIGPALVDLYASCGLLADAQDIFDRLPKKDVESFNVLMLGYVAHGHERKALQCFERLKGEEVCPDEHTLFHALKACCGIMVLDKGHVIHDEIVRQNLEACSGIGSALIEMYQCCNSFIEAKFIFDKLPDKDLSSWNTLLSGCINLGLYHEMIYHLNKMSQAGILPDPCTYTCCLKAWSILKADQKCHELHSEMIKNGFLRGIDFSSVPSLHRTVLWNAVITAYLILEQGDEALLCSKHMQQDGVFLDIVSYVCSLKASETSGDIDGGYRIHIEVAKLGLSGHDLIIDTALIDMYATLKKLDESLNVFTRILAPDVIAWNALISGFGKHDFDSLALNFMDRMKLEGILPNDVTYVCVLNACGNLGSLKKGQNIHSYVSEDSLETDLMGSALIGMYAKCGSFVKAQDALQKIRKQDISLWNALIAGFCRHNLFEEALSLYEQMHCQGVPLDVVTFVCSLKACATTGTLRKGHEMHGAIIKRGFLRKEFLLGNGLVDLYAKCGCLPEALKIFDSLPARDTVSWNTLITGYLLNDCGPEALMVSKQMHQESVFFDIASYLCSLKACGTTGAEVFGFILHSDVVKKGLSEWSLAVGNALIDMYVGCGLFADAKCVLQKLPLRDVVSWTTLIAGFLRNGCDDEALLCLQNMQQEDTPTDIFMWNVLFAVYSHVGEAEMACSILGKMKDVKPDEDSFQSILAACSHAGLVDKGQTLFEVMESEFGITPKAEHFACLVDLFGRAGQMNKAVFVIGRMPWQPDVIAWHTLMAACQKWGNVVVGMEAFEAAVKLDERDTSSFVCMFNILSRAINKAGMIINVMEESADVG